MAQRPVLKYGGGVEDRKKRGEEARRRVLSGESLAAAQSTTTRPTLEYRGGPSQAEIQEQMKAHRAESRLNMQESKLDRLQQQTVAKPAMDSRMQAQPTIPSPYAGIQQFQSSLPAPTLTNDQWLEQQKQHRRELNPELYDGKGFGDVVTKYIGEPFAQLMDRVQTIPGISNFQQGAGNAIGAETNTAPKIGGVGGKISSGLGMLSGLAVNPAALDQSLFAGGYKAANAAVNALESRSSKAAQLLSTPLNQRVATGAIAGAIQNTGLEATKGNTDAKELGNAALMGAAFGGLGDGTAYLLGRGAKALADRTGLSNALSKLFSRNGAVIDNATPDEIDEILALPAPQSKAQPGVNVLPKGNEPILGGAGATTARIAQRPNPWRDRYNELIGAAHDYKFTPGREMEELESLWSQMATREDPSLDELIKLAHPTYFSKIQPGLVSKARQTQQMREVSGLNSVVRNSEERLGVAPQSAAGRVEPPVEAPKPVAQPAAAPAQRPKLEYKAPEVEVRPAAASQSQQRPPSDELRFAQTVRDSDKTSPELAQELRDNPLTGKRTSDTYNREQATKLIEKQGIEGAASKLLAKRTNLSSVEVTTAQMLARHFSESGQLDKAIEIISKTAREGREMGQAIQALSQWNKLDQEGALLLAERQLNRGVSDTDQWARLTAEQAKPVQQAAQKIEQVQSAKELAEQVVKLLADKKPGSMLTPEESALISRFAAEVRQVDTKVKPVFRQVKNEREKVIQEVSKVKPEDRTRKQVVDFLEAKAAKARERLARQRNVGFAAQVNNPVLDYAIIGAAHIAKGLDRIADWSEAMVKDFGDSVKPHLNEAYSKAVGIFRKENGIPTDKELMRVVNLAIKNDKLDEQTANSLRAMASEIGFYLDDNLKKEAVQDLQIAIKSLGTSTLGEKISTFQTAGQLLSVPTFLRNAIGNFGQLALEKMNKLSAVPIDWALSNFTKERTIKFFPQNQEKFWRNFVEGTASGWKGVSPTGTLSSYDIHPNVFGDKNPLKYLTKTLGASLQGMDHAAYRSAYGDVVATFAEQLGKSRGLTAKEIKEQMPTLVKELDQRVYDLADRAGAYATYQDETMLSKAAQGVKRSLNKLTDVPVRAMVDKGMLPKSLSTEGFGLGDIVLKYARTPANLVMRGIDYSPLGIFRGIFELMPLVTKKGSFDQFQATRALSRAITGTMGLTAVGYLLADAGVLTGAASADKDMRSIQEQSGQGAYKVNWSGLKRWLMGGFDKDAAKFQKGDVMMDYAWMQPAAISLGMGVNANQIIKDSTERTAVQFGRDTILGGLRTVLENPMVTGLTNVVDATTDVIKRQDAGKFGDILKGVPASFIPSVVGQARNVVDNTQRETFDDNLLMEVWNIVKNKLPGASKSLPVSYDSLGKPRERIQGGEIKTIGQALNSFINPTKITRYDVTPEAKMVLDVLNDANDQGVLPRIGAKYIMVDDPITKKQKRVDLTAEQFSKLQQSMGQKTLERLQKSQSYLTNPSVSGEKKAKKIKDILTEVGQKSRNEIRVEMGYRKKREG